MFNEQVKEMFAKLIIGMAKNNVTHPAKKVSEWLDGSIGLSTLLKWKQESLNPCAEVKKLPGGDRCSLPLQDQKNLQHSVSRIINRCNSTGEKCSTPRLLQELKSTESNCPINNRRTMLNYMKRFGMIWANGNKYMELRQKEAIKKLTAAYLQQISNLDKETDRIYLDESYCDKNYCCSKSWFIDNEHRGRIQKGSGMRLLLLAAGHKDGWVQNSQLIREIKPKEKADKSNTQ